MEIFYFSFHFKSGNLEHTFFCGKLNAIRKRKLQTILNAKFKWDRTRLRFIREISKVTYNCSQKKFDCL